MAAATHTVLVRPVTRIEGHARVSLRLAADGRLDHVRLHATEFRGFERFLQGRPCWEAPVVVQRLCGICPVSHHLCAAKALDALVGVTALPPTAEKVRRLLHHAQVLQSHALHFFHLASPDLLLGFDAPADERSLLTVAAEHPDLARRAVALRSFGQRVIEALGGRRVHPIVAVPGGVNAALAPAARARLSAEAGQAVASCLEALALCRRLLAAQPLRTARFATFPSSHACLVRPDGALDLYDGQLKVVDAEGRTLVQGLAPEAYAAALAEEVRPWTTMTFPFLRALGPERGWFRVGPLAQLNVAARLTTPLAEREREAFAAAGGGKPVHSTLATHLARCILALHAAEVVGELLADPALEGTDLLAPAGRRRREGMAWIEAPRGTLVHHYTVDEQDRILGANLIVATTCNNQAMHEALLRVAQDELPSAGPAPALLDHLEVALRAFDPCLSCATHAAGRMPLMVTVETPDGTVLRRLERPPAAAGPRCWGGSA